MKEPDDRPVPGDKRFETVANASIDGLLVIDGGGIVQFANPAAVAMFVDQTEDLLGFHFGTPAIREPAELQISIKSDVRYVEMRASELSWNGRQAILAILRDITDRKLAAKGALQESEQKFQTLINQAPAALFLYGMDGSIIEYNQFTLEKYGYSVDEILNIKASDIDLDYRKRVKTGASWEELNRKGQLRFEARHRKKDGTIFPVEVNLAPIEIKGKEHYLALASDITERKQAETYREMGREVLQILNEPGDLQKSIPRVLAALKTRTGVDAVGLRLHEGEDFPYFAQDGFSKDFLLTENTLVARGKDGGVCRDKDGKACLECTCGLVISGKTDPANPLFTKEGSCWTNDSFSLLDLPSDQDLRLHPRNNCIHKGYASVTLMPVRPIDRIVELIQLNDKRKDRFTLETIEIPEGIAGHIGSALMRKREEEERLKLQSQLNQAQKMESIGLLAGGVAHDLNNTLQVILGQSEMAMEQVGPDAPLRAELEEIKNAAHRSADLTRQLLAFARKQSIKPMVLDLNYAVCGTLKILRRLIGEDIDLLWKPGAELCHFVVYASSSHFVARRLSR